MVARAGVAHGERACALLEVLIALLGVLVDYTSMGYFWLFYAGVLESFSIDEVCTWHHPGLLHSSPLVNNSLLLLLFCLPHSVLPRKCIKSLVSKFLYSDYVYRYFYSYQSCFLFFLICYGWSPLSTPTTPTLWDIQFTPLRAGFYGLCILGVVMNVVAFFAHPVLDFIGIREPLEKLTGRKLGSGKKGDLVTSGVYGVVRHPMYTSLLTVFWFHPTMTVSRFMIASVFTVYVVTAVLLFEEPSLVEEFGDSYREYMKTTPMLLPHVLPWKLYKQKNK